MKVRNTFIIFLVSGFWHGANWTFVVWGGLNAIYFLPLLLSGKNRNHIDIVAEDGKLPSLKEFFKISLTFGITIFAWIFFRANDMSHAINFLKGLFQFDFAVEKLLIERFPFEILPLVGVMLVLEWFSRNREHPLKNSNYGILKSVFLIFMILVFGSFSEMQEFIYFQF